MNNREPELLFSSILERDIDLLLAEELNCSEPFQLFFLKCVGEQSGKTLCGAYRAFEVWHSIVRAGSSSCQVDLQVIVSAETGTGLGRILLAIENKIDEEFQDRQPERYAEQVRAAVVNGEVERAVSILIAPRDYIDQHTESQQFDACVSYEALIDHFRDRSMAVDPEISRRCLHRLEMLEQAVFKYRRGYTPVPHVEVSAFWRAYHTRVLAIAPQLQLEDPGDKPADANWVNFVRALEERPPLPRCRLRHKLGHGRVDLEIPDAASWDSVRRQHIIDHLDPEMSIRPAGKSVAISIVVPPLDRAEPFDPQQENADAGIQAAARLKTWHDTLGITDVS